jgi:putative tryptophan/tyrosine transport system substrate-binding protein
LSWARGKPDTLPGLAQELVALKVDLLVAVAPQSVRAAKQATTTLPIVAVDLESDPVASGFAASLGRPGGNLTGLFLDHPQIAGKWLQLITEVVPGARRIAVLWDVSTGEAQMRAIVAAAKALSVELTLLELRDGGEMQSVLESGLKGRPQALVLLGSPLINQQAQTIAEFCARNRLPSISPFRNFAEGGGLMSYGVNFAITLRQLAPYVAKILKGAKPGDLAIEQPSHFEFIVNHKAAKALGLTLAQAVLVRADEVIR